MNRTPDGGAKQPSTLRPEQDQRSDQIIAMQAPAVGGEVEPVAWLVANKHSGFRDVRFEHPADMPFNRERWTWEPLYAHPTPVREPEGVIERLRKALADDARVMADNVNSFELRIQKGGYIRYLGDVAKDLRQVLDALAQPTPPSRGEENQEVSSSREPALAASGRNAGASLDWDAAPIDTTLWCVYGPDSFPTVFACKLKDHPEVGRVIWGFSIYRRARGFRTLGTGKEWAVRNDARLFDTAPAAFAHIAGLFRAEGL